MRKGCEEITTLVRSAMALTITILTHLLDSEISHYSLDLLNDINRDYRITSSVTTPLTPFSPNASPRHPSDIHKIHRCKFEDCYKSFNRPAKLAQHLRSHTNTRPFLCPHALCTKDFLRESHLKHHVKSAHSDVRDHVCEWEGCGKSFVTATRLKRHHATHEGREKFKCIIAGCGQPFRKHSTLQRHMIVVHEGRKPFICKASNVDDMECGAGFDTEGQLKAHAGKVHELNNFLCTICPPKFRSTLGNSILDPGHASFSTRTALREHIEIEHPPTCVEHGREYQTLRDLKSHLEIRHGSFDESEANSCHEGECERGFAKKGSLEMLLQSNHDPTLFVCGGIDPSTLSRVARWDGTNCCGEFLTTKASLEDHIRTAHQELAPFHNYHTKHGILDGSCGKHHVSVLTRLTGADYEEQSGRHIPCEMLGCNYRFLREYDLEIHLRSRHGLVVPGVKGKLHDQQTLQGPQTLAAKRVVHTQKAPNMHSDSDDDRVGHGTTLGAEACTVGDSWLEEQSYQHRVAWLRDELEMRYLIDGGLE